MEPTRIHPQARPLDVTRLATAFRRGEPFPWICIDEFLEPEFARTVAAAYPTLEAARRLGREFRSVNERRKVQVTEAARFPAPVRQLAELLATPAVVEGLGRIAGIPRLAADEDLVGGGMHVMGSGARLDVHADFNVIEDRGLYRRLNLLLFLNDAWQPEWGGELELWNADVSHCAHRVEPRLNRLVLFATSDTSFHGVRRLRCPARRSRISFAAYYYTREAPTEVGIAHSTLFRARPDEWLRGRVLMPAETAVRRSRAHLHALKRRLRGA